MSSIVVDGIKVASALAILILGILIFINSNYILHKTKKDPLTFRYWLLIYFLTLAFITLSFTRSFQYIVKYILIALGYEAFWHAISPLFVSINTIVYIMLFTMLVIFIKMRFEEAEKGS